MTRQTTVAMVMTSTYISMPSLSCSSMIGAKVRYEHGEQLVAEVCEWPLISNTCTCHRPSLPTFAFHSRTVISSNLSTVILLVARAEAEIQVARGVHPIRFRSIIYEPRYKGMVHRERPLCVERGTEPRRKQRK